MCVLQLFVNQVVTSYILNPNQAVLLHDQKVKYLENENSFLGEIKSIFHHFKGLSVVKNYVRPKSAPLRK